MKKFLFLLIIPFFFWGCEKTFNGTVESTPINYQVSSINPFDTAYYAPDDSLILVSVTFSSITDLKSTYFDIYNSAGDQLNNSPVALYDNGKSENGDSHAGDKTYSNLFPLSKAYPVGTYKINYFATDINDNTRKIAEHDFYYNNGQNNVAPVVSNLIAPDSAKIGVDTLITLHITVNDSNGLSDISTVFFNSFIPPDYHPSTNNPFLMYDDGLTNDDGDQIAGDGIYSLIVKLPNNAPTGVYRWEFQARDRGHLLSNKIIHNITIY